MRSLCRSMLARQARAAVSRSVNAAAAGADALRCAAARVAASRGLATASSSSSNSPALPNGSALVSADWVLQHLRHPRLKLVDASWYMPADNIDAGKQYLQTRIPGARYFPVDDIADKSSGLPHMMPSRAAFATAVGDGLGISNTDTIVVYDARGLFSAPRVWYTFRLFGARNVAVLDGGLPLWLHRKLPTESGPLPSPRPFAAANFDTADSPLLDTAVRTADQVLQNLRSGAALTIDARSTERFAAAVPEPRASLRRGHIPLSVNLPFTDLLQKNPDTGATHLKPVSELKPLYERVGVRFPAAGAAAAPVRPVINTCGSGMTACVNIFALHQCGYPLSALQLYDGSWTEWGANPLLPVTQLTPQKPADAELAAKAAAAIAETAAMHDKQ